MSLPELPFFTVEAPAKINLWLRILGRREDGFHELETRLAQVECADRLSLAADPGRAPGEIVFTCDEATVPGDESNLVLRAARALEAREGQFPGMRVHLEKRVPHGAGLGGGSSDAAAMLRLMRAVFRPELPEQVLREAAAEVGSDVPFFLTGGVADASGRGELVRPAADGFGETVGGSRTAGAPSGKGPRVLLVKPPFGIATPWAYRQWQDSREVPDLPYAPQPTALGELRNDLERSVFEKYQVLGHLKARLMETPGVTAALMSGSGSTVFALLEEAADTSPILHAVREETGGECWLADTRLRAGLPEIITPPD